MKRTAIPLPDAAQIAVVATACALQGACWTLLAITQPTEPTVATVLLAVTGAVALGLGAYAVPFMYLKPKSAWRATKAIHALTIATALMIVAF